MGTRSLIGKRLPDGQVRHIYVHWDGYPSHNGAILQEHYQDETKIDALLDEGAASSLAPEIGEAHDFDDRPDNWCTFYARDRGEEKEDCEAQTLSYEDYLGNKSQWGGAEYLYLYDDGKWNVLYLWADDPKLEDLEEVLINEAKSAK